MLCVYLWPPSEFCQRPSEADLLCQGYKILSLSQGRHCQQEEKDHSELMGYCYTMLVLCSGEGSGLNVLYLVIDGGVALCIDF